MTAILIEIEGRRLATRRWQNKVSLMAEIDDSHIVVTACHGIAAIQPPIRHGTNPYRYQEVPMTKRMRLALAALALTGLLGGCVAYPAYPGYGYGYPAYGDGYAPAYGYGYGGPGVVVAGGWGGGWHGGWGGGWHGGGWR
jgi:hypothetical protein